MEVVVGVDDDVFNTREAVRTEKDELVRWCCFPPFVLCHALELRALEQQNRRLSANQIVSAPLSEVFVFLFCEGGLVWSLWCGVFLESGLFSKHPSNAHTVFHSAVLLLSKHLGGKHQRCRHTLFLTSCMARLDCWGWGIGEMMMTEII